MGKGKLRKLFTNDDVLEAFNAADNSNRGAAGILTGFGQKLNVFMITLE